MEQGGRRHLILMIVNRWGVSLNGEREKKAEGVWGQQEGEWAGRGGGGGGGRTRF